MIGPSAIFLGTSGMPPIEAPLWTPSCKIEISVQCRFILFSLHTEELNFGQTIWDTTQVLLGTSWGTHLRTCWKQEKLYKFFFGSGTNWVQVEKTKTPIPHPPTFKKQKNWIVHDFFKFLSQLTINIQKIR